MKYVATVCTVLILTASISFSQTSPQKQMTKEDLTRFMQEKNSQINDLWHQKKYKEAIAILEEMNAQPNLSDVEGAQQSIFYNLACGYSLLGQKEKALESFEAAVGAGYADLYHISQDSDLNSIRNEPRFKAVCDKLKRDAEFWNNPLFHRPYRANISTDEKIAGLSLFWSEVKYNFVFLDHLRELNWDSLYLAYLPLVERTTSTAEYYRQLSRLCAMLHDGHTNVTEPRELWDTQFAVPGIGIWIVNDTVIVLSADDSLKQQGIVRGVQIVSVDGQPVLDYAEKNVYPYLSASSKQGLMTDAYWRGNLLAGPEGTSVNVEFRDSTGATFTHTLYRPLASKEDKAAQKKQSSPTQPTRPLGFKILPGNIGYVSLKSFGEPLVVAQFDTLFPEIQKTDALIIDVRRNGGGSSGYGWQILGYLTDKPFATGQWRTRDYRPSYRAWGMGDQWYGQKGDDFQPNGKNLYTKPVVVLAGPWTFSAAEDFCVAFDCMHRGTIIGQPTGGSTGQPLTFDLPGGGSARVCTKHDRYPDGREFVGVGVIPGIEVTRTVHEVLLEVPGGPDKDLHVALEYLKGKR